MTTTTLLIIGLFTSIASIIFLVAKRWQTSEGTVKYIRIKQFEPQTDIDRIWSVFECEDCGMQQHGNPPCEMCGSESMKPVN